MIQYNEICYNNSVHFVIKKNSFDMTFDFQMNLKNYVKINYKKKFQQFTIKQ